LLRIGNPGKRNERKKRRTELIQDISPIVLTMIRVFQNSRALSKARSGGLKSAVSIVFVLLLFITIGYY